MNFSDFLRKWRKLRRLSQMDLALKAEVSARHISFLESGRAKPSPKMISRLTQTLNLPMHDTNQAFLIAGFAPPFQNHPITHTDITHINSAVDSVLTNHMPFPAFMLNRHWDITNANSAAMKMMDDIGLAGYENLIEASMSDAAIKVIENWDEASLLLLKRLTQEYLESGADDQLGALVDRFKRKIHQRLGPNLPDIDYGQAVLPTRFHLGDQTLSIFSAITQFGSVFDTNFGDIRIELMFPLDDVTKEYFQNIA